MKTGKTFRLICRALADASEGKHVMFICGDEHKADYAIKMAYRMVDVLVETTNWKNRIEFPTPSSRVGTFQVCTADWWRNIQSGVGIKPYFDKS